MSSRTTLARLILWRPSTMSQSPRMTMTRAMTILFVMSAFACGGDDGAPASSGVTGTKRAADLTDPEVRQLCEWVADVQGGPREVQCPDDVTVTFPSADECVADYATFDPTCEVTVSQIEACSRALADDPCTGFGDPACQPLLECAFQ